MVPTLFAMSDLIYFFMIPLMVIIPGCMILITRMIAGGFGVRRMMAAAAVASWLLVNWVEEARRGEDEWTPGGARMRVPMWPGYWRRLVGMSSPRGYLTSLGFCATSGPVPTWSYVRLGVDYVMQWVALALGVGLFALSGRLLLSHQKSNPGPPEPSGSDTAQV